MRIGILGGAFDPITCAHMDMARVAATVFDEIWMMPCGTHAWDKEMAQGADRLRMIELATKLEPKIKPCRYELELGSSPYTYDIMWDLLDRMKHLPVQLGIVIGMDNANKIKEWYRYADLVNLVPFLVVKRKGVEATTNWFNEPPHQCLDIGDHPGTLLQTNALAVPVSSTLVRQTIQKGEDPRHLLHLDVWDHIKAKGLYQKVPDE